MTDFKNNNPHEENIRISIDKILGQKTTLRKVGKVRKGSEDKKKESFINIINMLSLVEERECMMMDMFGVDMIDHNLPFHEIISSLMDLHYSVPQLNIINWFLYDRFKSDGTVEDIADADNVVIPMETPEDLYEFIKKLK